MNILLAFNCHVNSRSSVCGSPRPTFPQLKTVMEIGLDERNTSSKRKNQRRDESPESKKAKVSRKHHHQQQHWKQRRHAFSPIAVGMRLVLCTCDTHREPECALEMRALLQEVLEQFDTSTSTLTTRSSGSLKQGGDHDENVIEQRQEQPSTIAEALDLELKYLARTTSNGANGTEAQPQRLRQMDAGGVAGVVIFEICDQGIDPVDVVMRSFQLVEASKCARTRRTIRIVPAQMACRATIDAFAKYAPKFISEQFRSLPPGSFAVTTYQRGVKMPRREMCAHIGRAVGEANRLHVVDLQAPHVTVHVESTYHFALLSVIASTDFRERYENFNMRRFVENHVHCNSLQQASVLDVVEVSIDSH